MKAEILKMLREADGYISGQEICEKFNVSRTAFWKVIRRLQEDGYEVEAVRNKGYRMVESPDILTKEEVESCMHTEWVGRNVVCYKVTDSTNLRIKQMGDEGALAGRAGGKPDDDRRLRRCQRSGDLYVGSFKTEDHAG